MEKSLKKFLCSLRDKVVNIPPMASDVVSKDHSGEVIKLVEKSCFLSVNLVTPMLKEK